MAHPIHSADNEEEASGREAQIVQRKQRIETINKEHRETKKKFDDLSNERKVMWQEDANLDRQIQLASEEVRKAGGRFSQSNFVVRTPHLSKVNEHAGDGRPAPATQPSPSGRLLRVCRQD